jgi:UDP-sugar pyrophosphorylase
MDEIEVLGLQELPHLCIVLIAGGLGERLGYSGIKIDLPVCTIEEDYSYLKFYIQYIHAIRTRALQYIDESVNKDDFYVPLAIMVSDDTEARTVALLEKNNYFGLKREHVDLMKQENVPALIDDRAQVAIADNEFKIITKPHGHGDVHTLLY